jgi:hypothetical protein
VFAAELIAPRSDAIGACLSSFACSGRGNPHLNTEGCGTPKSQNQIHRSRQPLISAPRTFKYQFLHTFLSQLRA